MSSDFDAAYRLYLVKHMRCPECGEQNTPNASLMLEVNQVGTRAFCNNCSADRPLAAFLPKGIVHGGV